MLAVCSDIETYNELPPLRIDNPGKGMSQNGYLIWGCIRSVQYAIGEIFFHSEYSLARFHCAAIYMIWQGK